MNVTWTGEGPQALDSIHISIAVATDRGLITPIIRDAATKGVQEISANAKVQDRSPRLPPLKMTMRTMFAAEATGMRDPPFNKYYKTPKNVHIVSVHQIL